MKINFILNGRKINIDVDPFKTLLRVLKEDLLVNSVKEGCGRGECGTCTVLIDGKPVTSCMVAAGQAENRSITTLEGLEGEKIMQTIQQAFIDKGGIQCGFCTPGFLISSFSLLKDNPEPTREEVRLAVSGNICRCTGYTKIIDSVMEASKRLNS